MAEEGESVSLRCLPQGFPKPNITWSKVDGDLPEQTILQFDGVQLVFTDSSEEDAGTYVCTANNVYGSADEQYVVQVMPSTSPPTDTATAPTPPQNRMIELCMYIVPAWNVALSYIQLCLFQFLQ